MYKPGVYSCPFFINCQKIILILVLVFKVNGLPTPVTVCSTNEVNAGQIGRIISPSFPENYGDNLDCNLTLKNPRYNRTEITYDIFSIEST